MKTSAVRFNNSGFSSFVAQTDTYCAWWSARPHPDRLFIRRPGRDEPDRIELVIGGWCVAASDAVPDADTETGAPPPGQGSATIAADSLAPWNGHYTVEQVEIRFRAAGALGAYTYAVVFHPDRITLTLTLEPARPLRLQRCLLGADGQNRRSRFDADTILNPQSFLSGFHRHALDRPMVYETELFTPAPFCYPLRFRGGGEWMSASLEPAANELAFTGFFTAPDRTGRLAFHVEYESRPDYPERYVSPPLTLRFGAADEFDALRRHAEGLVANNILARPARTPAPWWRGVMVCGWRQQVRQAGHNGTMRDREAACTQALYEAHVAALEQAGIAFDILIVDDGWSRCHGVWEPELSRWPDLRGFIRGQHDRGRRVLLWICANPDGLPDDEVFRVGEARYVDPGNAVYRARVADACHRLLGKGPDGYDADGFKYDFTASRPRAAPVWNGRLLHGMDYLSERFRLVRDAAKAARPDALLDFQAANPYFAHLHDMTRLNDFWSLPELGWLDMATRAGMARAVTYDALVDTDHITYRLNSYAGGIDYFRDCHRLGNVSLYLNDDDLRDPDLVAAVREGIRRFRAY